MANSYVLVLILVFCTVAGLSWALVGWFGPRPIQARLKQAVGEGGPGVGGAPKDVWREKIVTALSPAGKLTLPSEGWENSPFRQRFIRAGMRGERTALLFFAVKSLLTFSLPLLFILIAGAAGVAVSFKSSLIAIVGLAALGYYGPNFYLSQRIKARQLQVFEALPDAIDLMTVMVEAGLGLDAAIARMGLEIGVRSPVLEDEFRLVGLELRAGASRNQALRNLAARTGVEEIDLLVAMLVQTDRFGTSLAESLRIHADALRTKRRQRAEEAAAKIPLKLLFPLLCCIFPSIMIVLMGPAVISIYRMFVPFATGQG